MATAALTFCPIFELPLSHTSLCRFVSVFRVPVFQCLSVLPPTGGGQYWVVQSLFFSSMFPLSAHCALGNLLFQKTSSLKAEYLFSHFGGDDHSGVDVVLRHSCVHTRQLFDGLNSSTSPVVRHWRQKYGMAHKAITIVSFDYIVYVLETWTHRLEIVIWGLHAKLNGRVTAHTIYRFLRRRAASGKNAAFGYLPDTLHLQQMMVMLLSFTELS